MCFEPLIIDAKQKNSSFHNLLRVLKLFQIKTPYKPEAYMVFKISD